MKNKFYQWLMIGLVFVLNSCNSKDGNSVRKVAINDLYSVEIPDILSKATNLNDEASLQYQNLFKELYIIVLDETKESVNEVLSSYDTSDSYQENVRGYANLMIANFATGFDEYKVVEEKETELNGMKCILYSIDSESDGIKCYYNMGLFESKSHYYQVHIWTLKEKKDEHLARMDAMMKSFKEVNAK